MNDYRDFRRFDTGAGAAWLNTRIADGWELLASYHRDGHFQAPAGWQFLVGHRTLPKAPPMPMPDELKAEPEALLLGVKDAALLLGVSTAYMYELVRTAQIPSVSQRANGRGRKLIPRKDIAEWILKRTERVDQD
jgi:hypothetical protein